MIRKTSQIPSGARSMHRLEYGDDMSMLDDKDTVMAKNVSAKV